MMEPYFRVPGGKLQWVIVRAFSPCVSYALLIHGTSFALVKLFLPIVTYSTCRVEICLGHRRPGLRL